VPHSAALAGADLDHAAGQEPGSRQPLPLGRRALLCVVVAAAAATQAQRAVERVAVALLRGRGGR
jgi:hypothetical protein